MGILERIKDIEHELSKTQKNKATTTHIGLLKSQLARLRTELMMPAPGSGKSSFSLQICEDAIGDVTLCDQ